MAALGVRVQEAPTPMYKCSYHVFLSFRGKDTRKTFTDHLHTAMMYAGFRTFKDDDELEIGEDIELGLDKAIQESKVSVIIFSKDYASSRWCLDELLKILERKNTVSHIILPVFYHVHPSEVRNQTGSFATAFMRHEEHLNAEIGERKKEGMAKIKRWKAAPREVADLEGEVLEDRHESKFVQHIVGVIGRKLNRIALNISKYQISLDSHIKDINFWFQDESADGQNRIMMIYGMAGIGKTTIAKTVYNLHFERFHGRSSFLADVRETARKPNGLVSLQKQLISSILKGRKVKIGCVDEGITMIRDLIHHKRVLVVLDDVDDMDQLHALGIRQDWFHPGSKVIITTRCGQLLKTHKLYKVHKVEKLSEYESLILFSLHAFEEKYPKEGYLELSKRVVHYCGGVPLALEVLGSCLFGRNVDVWESTLRKLEVIPNSIILRKLKISYDSLEDDHDKSLFLDIACFFVGKSKQYVSTILAGCDFYTELGIQNLVDRCLLTIDEHNKLIMHQILQDMGREIVREESPSDLGKRSRLWCAKESIDVLTEKTGTETIEGLALNWTDEEPAKSFSTVKNSKRRNFGDFADKWKLVDGNDAVKRRRLGLFSWLPINHALSESSSTLSDVIIRTDMFARMHKLRLLQLSNIQLRGAVEEFPKKLRWLYWRGSTLKYIPSAFPMESLVALDMRYSSLEQFWKGTKVLKFLKILNLSHSQGLTITPDFSQIPNLERLILKSCINLSEVHESIGDLGRLVLLNLSGCKILRKLPRRICLLKHLEELILSGCSRLDELPTGLRTMKYLKMLHADGTAIAQATSAPTEVKPWSFVFWSSTPKPRRIPKPTKFSLASLSRSLTNLSLANCNLSDSAIPEDFGSLSMLRKLNVSTNPFCSLPESIKGLSRLQSLRLNDCTRLQSLSELPTTLTELALDKCWSLERVTNLPNLLMSLDLQNCQNYKLVEVQGLFKLEPLGNTDAELINCLRLFNLESLQNVKVDLFDAFSVTYRKVVLQGLFECSIFSTFIPASEVPDWFNTKSVGPLISTKMPPLPLPNLRVLGFNICILYAYYVIDENAGDVRTAWLNQLYIRVSNKTKNLKWFYSPTFIGMPGIDDGMLWLSYWKIGNQLEVGDEVDILVLEKGFFEVKEVGFDLVYDEEEAEGTSYKNDDPACSQNNSRGVDLSEYEVKRGSFFLCHHNHKFHKLCSSDDRWISSRWYKNFFGDE